MTRRFAVGVVFLVVLAVLVVEAHSALPGRIQPLKLSKKNDFSILEPESLSYKEQEVWLCPYAFSSVPVNPSDAELQLLLQNLTRIIDNQFNYTQYGTYCLPLDIQNKGEKDPSNCGL